MDSYIYQATGFDGGIQSEEGQGIILVLSICVILPEQREYVKGSERANKVTGNGTQKGYEPLDKDMLQRVLATLVSENLSHLDSCMHLEFESH